MNKGQRISLNLLIFAIIAGFVWYMAASLLKDEPFFGNSLITGGQETVSPYKKINSIKTKSPIVNFDLLGDNIYIAANKAVMIYDQTGTLLWQFPVEKEIRDIKVENDRIFLLYPAEIEIFTFSGERVNGWEARRDNSDYCAMALSDEYVFVTDVANKNICKYRKEGDFMAVIFSPMGFIIPSYTFDIIHYHDTLYCTNSGRQRIESYTLQGEYIASFGTAGSEAGSFAGCCNPTFIAATQRGDIVTSEKGNPRISCFSRDGQFRAILLNSKALGGGTKAYSLKVQENRIYVAGKNTLSIYAYDPQLATQSTCAGCPADCPLRK